MWSIGDDVLFMYDELKLIKTLLLGSNVPMLP